MARAVGPVFADAEIAKAVNFSAFPLTGGSLPFGGCDAADDSEACAHYASDCVDGCTGPTLQKLTAFYSCLEHGWIEMFCAGGDSKANTCIASSGVDHDKFTSCKSDKALLQKIQAQFNSAGSRVHSFPKVLINGKDASMAQDPKSLRAKLCSAGVQAACESAVLV